MAKATIQPGDRFVKVGMPDTVWIATRLIELPNLPMHVHLMNERDDLEMQTLSEVALIDRNLYQKVQAH
ncbi:hypothetical protein [Terasakiella pusilla]|jgi:hypothetical protein|uniref:hypothetical protein n=1 Tax=Terasakiella pusilla TaxID=64973 RepID=UPI00048F6D2F|nr:hypothetical protein [Terasakiella pusilla]